MKLTQSALGSSRLTLFVAVLLMLGGILTFLSFPSQEEPSITVREALVSVAQPGLPTEQVERLLARPVEERLREVAGIKRMNTTVRPGMAIIQLTAYDNVEDLPALWQRVRSKAAEAEGTLPQGAYGPFIDDEFGRVAIASVAVTAPGFSTSEMRTPLRALRAQLYTIPGVERVSMHGLQEEQVYIDFDRAKLTEAGLTPAQVATQLQQQNVVAPGGLVSASGMSMSLSTSGEITGVGQLRQFLVTAQREGTAREVALGQLARIHVMPVDPPQSAAVYQGQPAVVVAVSMAKGRNVAEVGAELRKKLDETAKLLPVGFQQHVVTFQADVVEREMGKMHHVMAETIIIVMAVVMLFLGWRTGLIVGAIVPLTILGSLIVMRALGIELQSVSIAAIIIALGLLVDNGIVIAEDIERRLGEGESRWSACEAAGRTLAVPLLTSSLVIVLAFSPFFFGETSTNEYLRSLPIVLGVTLLGSWLLSITVTPLLCLFFAKAHVHKEQAESYDSRFYRGYRTIIEKLLQHRLIFIGSMLGLLASAVLVLVSIPYDFLPKSDRLQFQIPVTLEPGADSRETMRAVKSISRWLADEKVNPEVVDSIGYVADGGPRIVLGLNPPLPAPNIAYFTVSIKPNTDIDQVIARTRSHIRANFPQLRAEPKRFSLGATEAGVAVYRITGPDEDVLRRIAGEVAQALKALPGTIDVYDDWQARVPRYVIDVDPLKARRAGISHQDVAQALEMRFSGLAVSVVREEGVNTPIVMRGSAADRNGRADPGDTPIYPQNGGAPVPLSAIATVSLSSEPSTLVRRNLERTITVTGQNPGMTATQIVSTLQASIDKIALPPGYRLVLGGEIEDSAEANQALTQFLPHALGGILLLFIWQFNSFRKLFIVMASVPFVLIGAALALLVTGFPFGFMATFGLLALAGIIVNNAVLLLERIEAELKAGLGRREAVVAAALKRLRPIVMTKLVCIVGLIPLMLFAGPLWTSMAITMIGGLALGTLVTLGLIPILYETLFSLKVPNLDARGAPEEVK
ncbi:efflux RND transporter permease subunit [Pseudoxanthomonas sp. Root630]|uniref:efflux RND transporter permease subunit n=1 Tax=Pseudoxanthomonas sp. Root630 TaxID=1736574 RepID=UPI000702766E|nr:efflux RND transporter permease subunit [Pseudoxanthomonas sp. Root630]KRA50267.1 acriflavin resistance protein [Pseudoxanthomonas sp. Root630]